MSYTSSHRTVLNYPEATRAFNDTNFILDLNEATQRYAQMQKALFPKFATISAQLHSLDLQSIAPPLRLRWNAIHSDFVKVMKDIRMNTVNLTGRAKVFCTVVFPTVAKNLNNVTPRSHQEKIEILQSYMKITSDNIASYVGAIMSIVSKLTVFYKDLAELAYQHSPSASGRNDVSHLAVKFLQLENHLKQLYHSFNRTESDTTIIAKTATRLIAFSGFKPQKSNLSAHRVALADENMTWAYDQLEQSKSEVTHAHYAAEVSHHRTGVLNIARSAVSSFVFDLMVNVEHGLSLFLAVYHSIMNDCLQMVAWLQNPVTGLPLSVSVYVESGKTLYAPIGAALELYSSESGKA